MTRQQLSLPPVTTNPSAILSQDILHLYNTNLPQYSSLQPLLIQLYRQGFLRYNNAKFEVLLDTLSHRLKSTCNDIQLPQKLKKELFSHLQSTTVYESSLTQLSPHLISWFDTLQKFKHKNTPQSNQLPIVETVVIIVRSQNNEVLCISQEGNDSWFVPGGNKMYNESIIQAGLRILDDMCNISHAEFKNHITSVQNFSKIKGFHHKTIEHYVEFTISHIPKSKVQSKLITYQPLSLIQGQKWKQLNYVLTRIDRKTKPITNKILLATNNPFYEKLSNMYTFRGDYELLGGNNFVKDITYREYGHDERDNARLKAFTYFEKTGFPCVGMDIGLYFKGKAQKASPGVHIKRIARVNDLDSDQQMAEKIVSHYSNVVKTYSKNGKLPANMVITFSYFDGNKYTDLKLTEEIVLSQHIHKQINFSAPLLSLFIDSKTSLPYYDSTSYEQSSWFTQLPQLASFIDQILNQKPLQVIEVISNNKNHLLSATSLYSNNNHSSNLYFINPYNSIYVASYECEPGQNCKYNWVRTYIKSNTASRKAQQSIAKKILDNNNSWSISQSKSLGKNLQNFPFILTNDDHVSLSSVAYVSSNSIKSKRFERNISPLYNQIQYINTADLNITPPDEHGQDIFENAEIKAKYYWNVLAGSQSVITENVSMVIGDAQEMDIPYQKIRQNVIDFYGSYSDDLMIQFYQNIVKKYKKPLPVRFEFAFCIYDGIRVQTAKAVSDIPLYLNKKQHSYRVNNFPISSLLCAKIDNKLIPFSKLTPSQIELIESPLRNTIRPLIHQFTSHKANELVPIGLDNLQYQNRYTQTLAQNRGGNVLGEIVTAYITNEFVTIFYALMNNTHKSLLNWLIKNPQYTYKVISLGIIFQEIGIQPKSFVVKK